MPSFPRRDTLAGVRSYPTLLETGPSCFLLRYSEFKKNRMDPQGKWVLTIAELAAKIGEESDFWIRQLLPDPCSAIYQTSGFISINVI